MKKIKQRFFSTEKYRIRYNQKCNQWQTQPKEDKQRKFNDKFCLVICLVLLVFFIGIGVYYIKLATQDDNGSDLTDFGINILNEYIVEILLCIGASICLGIIYTFLLKLASKLIIYFMITATLAVLVYLIFLSLIGQEYMISLILVLPTILYCVIMICYRQQIKIGVVLIKIASKFMLQKKVIFVAILIKLILTLIITLFWMYGLSAIAQQKRQQSRQDKDTTFIQVVMTFYTLLMGYFTLLVYYMMVFNISVVFAYWYYQIQLKFPLTLSWKWIIKYSIGSLGFAALLVLIAKLFSSVLDSRKKYTKNCAAAICLKLIKCIFSQVTSLLQVLNHNTIITIAVTGQSFIGAAKTTLGLIGQQFAVVSMMSRLLFLWGWIFSIGIPILIGYNYIGKHFIQTLLITFVIIYFTTIITGLILSILLECLSCVLIFYCFDKRFRQIGCKTHRMPQEIDFALNKTNQEAIDHYVLLRS